MRIKNSQELDRLIAEGEYNEKLAAYKMSVARDKIVRKISHPEKYLFKWLGQQFSSSNRDKGDVSFITIFLESFFRALSR